ncbi:MAG: TolC family protein [Gammaproteobacteria bacterium]|nr:TolC family protein [Gammaproteobacteria bacterium]
MKKNQFSILGLLTPGVFALATVCSTSAIAEDTWTLESSVKRVLQVAPETQAGQQMIGIREMQQQQASLWPNPEIEIRADEAMGLDDGSGGYDLTELVISQPIPVKRLQSQGKQAAAMLSVTHSQNLQQQLMLEHKTAMLFHELQLKSAIFALSQQRLEMVDQFKYAQKAGKRSTGQLVRYLSPLEQKRLAILRETARQASSSAEGELNESASQFRILLNLDQARLPAVSALNTIPETFDLSQLQQQLSGHPKMQAAQHAIAAANAEIDLARASRYKDPTVNLFVERDNFNSQRETYTGISVNLEIPLWNENKRELSVARANLIESRTELEMQRRELNSRLQQSFMHYGHLLEQASDYRTQLLKPAEDMFQLSRKSFAAGEQNILGLIDSHNTYFEIRRTYLELLAAAGQELASLRLAAGLSLIDSTALVQGDIQ